MNLRSALGLALFAALSLVVLASRGPSAAQESSAARTPVLVELFTSEGCSSCPPADALIARLARTQPVPGAEIIPVKLHVDYWNRLGWTDPFSSAAFTARQSRYADFFENNSVYTPQMVVDGRTEFVGSSEAKALRAIAFAARPLKAPVEISFAGASRTVGSHTQQSSNSVTLTVRLPALSDRTPGEASDVFLAVTEDNIRSNVSRGENAGRSFEHIAVVRSLRAISRVQPGQPGVSPISVDLALEPAWRREHLHAVVFVQEETSRRILAAASRPLAPSH